MNNTPNIPTAWPQSHLAFGELSVPVPIVQGGMGVGISMSGLASAVANAGGIGVISAALTGRLGSEYNGYGDDRDIVAFRDVIRRTRELTDGVIGVNIMVAAVQYGELVDAALDEGVDIIFSGAGLPLELPGHLKEGHKTKLVPIVSSGKGARIVAKRWMNNYGYVPDGFVLEGPEAGGHLGYKVDQIFDEAYALEALLPDLRVEVDKLIETTGKQIAVIAGGGLFTGADIAHIMSLGADGVQMATRFIATEECDADQAFKDAIIACTQEDISIIASPVGMPGRALDNQFLREVKSGSRSPKACAYDCLITCKKTESPYCIASALINAYKGRTEHGFVFTGAQGHRVTEMTTVPALIDSLREEYIEAVSAHKEA